MAVSANRLELLQIADAVAREKAIDRGIVIAAMEDAIAKAARSRYGALNAGNPRSHWPAAACAWTFGALPPLPHASHRTGCQR